MRFPEIKKDSFLDYMVRTMDKRGCRICPVYDTCDKKKENCRDRFKEWLDKGDKA